MKLIFSLFRLFSIIGFAFLQFGCLSSGSSDLTPAATTPTATPTPTPTPAPALNSLNQKRIAVGAVKMFAINTSIVTKSCGGNYEPINSVYGQLGLGISTNTNYTSLQALSDAGTTNYVSITAGEITACGITAAQHIKCWGSSTGDGGGIDRNAPILNSDSTMTYIDLASGSYHSCGVTTGNVMKCWGDGFNGKLGNSDGTYANQANPVVADSGTSYVRVAAGRNHTCGITLAGALKCFGADNAGQIGDGVTSTERFASYNVDPGTTYKEVAAGEDSSCGITTAGVLKCWGDNGSGQLGTGNTTQKTSATIIDPGVLYSKISIAGTFNFHTCGITATGVLKCWGENGNGQLGTGNTTASNSPVVIDSGVSYREVVVNQFNSCGITTTGVLKCWGDNSSGQLGVGSTTQQTSPTVVPGTY